MGMRKVKVLIYILTLWDWIKLIYPLSFVISNVAKSLASFLFSLIFFSFFFVWMSWLWCFGDLLVASFFHTEFMSDKKPLRKERFFSLLKVFIVAAFNNIPKEYKISFFMLLCIIIIIELYVLYIISSKSWE